MARPLHHWGRVLGEGKGTESPHSEAPPSQLLLFPCTSSPNLIRCPFALPPSFPQSDMADVYGAYVQGYDDAVKLVTDRTGSDKVASEP